MIRHETNQVHETSITNLNYAHNAFKSTTTINNTPEEKLVSKSRV